MRKFIDAERLREEIKSIEEDARKVRVAEESTMNQKIGADGQVHLCQKLNLLIDSLQKEVELPPVVTLSQFPTLRQSIEEQIYVQVMRKIPGCPPHAGITVSFTLRPSTVKNLKKDYEQNGIPATAVGKVFTNTDPKNLYVESDKWDALLGQFENGQRVRIILVKED